MDFETIKQVSDNNYLHVYNRFSVAFDHGEGVYLYDVNGKKYLDFGSGIGVMALGYGDKEYSDALKNQIDKLLHTSNLFYHEPGALAAEKFCQDTGMKAVFFTNSGAEAIEGAIKAAKKYFYKKTGRTGAEVIAMDHSFHGRTVGAVSVTGTDHYREPFYPLMGGVKFATFNDYDSVAALVNENTCAIVLETVQGEGGIYPASKEFLKKVRALCDEKDILLILDEIQCGMGRSGKLFAYQHYDVMPDILTSAKGIGMGVPVGCFALSEKCAGQSLEPGDHGSTYGGNPLVTTAVYNSLKIMEERKLPDHAFSVSKYLEERLENITKDYEFVKGHRGLGLMQGLVLDIKPADVVKKCLEKGLVVLTAGADVLRLLPPLVIEKEHVDEMESILRSVFDEM